MREFTKSLFSFSWAMSLFGAQQLANVFRRPSTGQPKHRTTAAFDTVTAATEEQLGDALRETFKAGDRLQKGMVDALFGLLTLGGWNPNRSRGRAADAPPQAGTGFSPAGPGDWGPAQEGMGWGPMPPAASGEERPCC